MIYTQKIKDDLIEATRDEVDYSGWDKATCDRLFNAYDAVPLGTDLVATRDFEELIADGQLEEKDLDPIESVILSYDYFFGYR